MVFILMLRMNFNLCFYRLPLHTANYVNASIYVYAYMHVQFLFLEDDQLMLYMIYAAATGLFVGILVGIIGCALIISIKGNCRKKGMYVHK